jgi:hypothetical protein
MMCVCRGDAICESLITITVFYIIEVMVFNVTFNNISVISWRSVLLVEETGENHRPAEVTEKLLSHNVISSAPRQNEIRTHNISGNRH